MTDRTAPDALLLVQALVNTLDVETGEDELAAEGGTAAFLRAHGVPEGGLGQGEPPAAPDGPRELRGLRDLQELREALRAVCTAHTARSEVAADTARTLDRLLAGAPLVLAVGADGGAALRPAAALGAVAHLTARIAAGIATAAADGTWARLKACEAHDCRWVFYDKSPAGRSRWCSMAVCGSRAKMRTYRARRAEAP
ncbi:CGNR zinc finger domain-containing protein [Streptomyces sp. NPDC101150]|uniref:CGNR zinc finger domain-containing protein n=1 Tax=Streptomyces sp. NPDC101150 TaxID=3366114 RepID=UPI0038241674